MYWLVVESTCWINCYSESSHSLEPFCYLNNDKIDNFCTIEVHPTELHGLSSHDWHSIILIINVTEHVNYLDIRSYLPEFKLEITAFRPFNQITTLETRFNNHIVSTLLLLFLPNLKHISLSGVSLHYFPSFGYLNKQLTSLILQDLKILSNVNTIGKNSIGHMHNLEFLSLSPNAKTFVTDHTFSGLTTLTYLHTTNIQMPNIILTLSPLVRLKTLAITNANIHEIEFLNEIPSLYPITSLDFSNNNISSFSSDTFCNYSQLNELYLCGNSITTINRSNFTSLNNLTYISLCSNQISTVTDDTFKDMPFLKYINLQKNYITTLPSRAFEYLSDVKQIYTTENPIHCDCSLQWMSIVRQNYGKTLSFASCTTPAEHSGKPAVDPSIYISCTRELSYHCFDKSINCPRGSYCHDTQQGYECVCEGERVVFSHTLNACIAFEELEQTSVDNCLAA